ncbi:telomere stability and silencing-domain-containing protein [Aspergillus granulosus]|uniref:Telomere stability and silencing-domain-containing protein n=1 Tax=Aspergillus granulosus TaxID=176169 RepID=A0ABR4H6M7_9EURO
MPASQVNVLLSSFPGLSLPSTVSFALPATSTLSDLCEKVSSYIPSSVSLQSLVLTTTSNKQILPSSRTLSELISPNDETTATSTLLPLRLSVPMCGGKGGFGSQLRAAGGRMSSRRKRNQGDDNGSSRNLDGRRLRTVNEAKALAEYLAVKPEMDKKEKEERRRRWQAVVEAAEKRQEELKNGGGKLKIDGQWMEDKDEMNEKAREAVLAAMKEGVWTDNLKDHLLGGSSTSASEGSGHETPSASEESEEEEEMKDAPAGPSQAAAPRRYIGFDDDDEFMSDSEEEEETITDPKVTRVITPRQRIPLPRQQPRRFFPIFSRPGNVSALDFTAPVSRTQPRNQSTQSIIVTESVDTKTPEDIESTLPLCCPGCGAYSQTVEPDEPGYYSKTRKQTRQAQDEAEKEEQSGHGEALAMINEVLEKTGSTTPKPGRAGALLRNATETVGKYLEKSQQPVQICDRCHDLRHHNKGVTVISPTIHSIRAYLDESPHRDNRIYHIIDAADFPMSVVDGIYEELSIQEQRSHNRRATIYKYKHGKKLPTISFIITRSDLLAPTKELADSKMEYIRSVLREKLRIPREEFRMGNVHMISAQRGWWTTKVKEEIRDHGGGLWIVGRANVGKSSFVEACLPKDSKNFEKMVDLVERRQQESQNSYNQSALTSDGLLPPAPKEDLYPVLPVVSSLPGTTVSPIRIPFGRGRGEVIDLPGLDRPDLSQYVLDEDKRDLIMTRRQKPERHTIKPGQSLLLGGGLVRITPVTSDAIVLAACFVPIEAHLTKTEKAIEMQAQSRPYPKTNIVKEGTGELISTAGVFDLKWDVTRSHLPGTLAQAIKDKRVKQIPDLPYRVLSADILIEGCGWIELTAQIRANPAKDGNEPAMAFPQVEVFTPNGKHIAARKPIECWGLLEQKKKHDQRRIGPRGRQSISHRKRILGSQGKL